jgi:hypothetical protein
MPSDCTHATIFSGLVVGVAGAELCGSQNEQSTPCQAGDDRAGPPDRGERPLAPTPSESNDLPSPADLPSPKRSRFGFAQAGAGSSKAGGPMPTGGRSDIRSKASEGPHVQREMRGSAHLTGRRAGAVTRGNDRRRLRRQQDITPRTSKQSKLKYVTSSCRSNPGAVARFWVLVSCTQRLDGLIHDVKYRPAGV